MSQIDNIVKEMLRKHHGGRKFFDSLDDTIRNDESLINNLMNIVPKDKNIVVSGRFGRVFSNYFSTNYPKEQRKVIAVKGGLRKEDLVDDLSYLDLKGEDFVFLDDSLYSGKTRDKIREELQKQGADISLTCVVYDGSKEKDSRVLSLYRYYENY